MFRPLLVLPLVAGCVELGLACTEMGCIGTLTVHLSRPLADDAVVSVEVDGEPRACAIDADDYGTDCALADGEDGPTVSIRTGSRAYEHVVVTIEEAGAIVFDDEIDPEWGEVYYPNGKACDGPDGGCIGGEADLLR